MRVHLTYFKQTGKAYADESYESEWDNLLDIHREVRNMHAARKLPGLVEGHSNFIVLIQVPSFDDHYPRLIVEPEHIRGDGSKEHPFEIGL